MHVWNVLHAARWKYRTQKIAICAPSHNFVYIFVTKVRIDNRKKLVKQQFVLQMCLQYGEHRPTNGWHLLASLGHPSKFQQVSRFGSVTARHSSSGRQSNCGVEQRASPIFARAAITLGIGPRFIFYMCRSEVDACWDTACFWLMGVVVHTELMCCISAGF